MFPWHIELLLIVAAFVAGALVYRNNAKKAEEELARIKRQLQEAKDKAGIK